MVLVLLKKRGDKDQSAITIEGKSASEVTVGELKKVIAARTNLPVGRQRLTNDGKQVLDDDSKTIDQYRVGGGEGGVILKDMGPQIAWKTVFMVEYLGPLIIHPLVYYYGKEFYSESFVYSKAQTYAFWMVMAHFFKREMETLFVHRFSHATMPAFNIIKNSAHYWILSGLALAIPLYGPWHGVKALSASSSFRHRDEAIFPIIGFWLFCEFSNLLTHLHLRSLRPPGTRKRSLPTGYGFGLCWCPNYLFEGLGWVAFSLLTMDWAAWGFTIVSVSQMALWAMKNTTCAYRKRAYKKEFGKAAGNKAAIFPGIL